MRNLLPKILGSFVVSLTFVFLYAPIVVLIIFSFNSKPFPSKWESFTLHWYYELFQSSEIWTSFLVSIIVASAATMLSLLMGCFLIFFQASGGHIRKGLPLFYANLVFPETVLGTALLGYFLLLRIPLGIQTLIISHTILGLGFVIPVLYTRYRQIDKRLEEASLNLGATKIQTYFRVTLPLLRPSMIACGLLIFILSFDDFALSFFTAGTGVQTISLHLLSMLRVGIEPTMNALSAVLLTLSSILVILFFSPRIRTKLF